ncbi:hypothetical protein ASE14_11935 [Agromyces sp. Root81]|uniref:hypothetical protein n=1 Tax=Agromyces sp. Root81 TaxID=1736601 RepID=UPI0007023745|nr:hypothetical protein [Agromyces sp. Root81]KRC61550.1 hypothetical protein ASE14_11935 [Agromyces sp. Root81]
MSTTEMDAAFARGVRAELTAIGTNNSRLQRRQRRVRTVAWSLSAVVVAGATTGAAVIVNSLPGTTTVAPLGDIVSATNTGTASIDLGFAPANATVVIVDLTCVSDDGMVFLQTVPGAGYEGPDTVGMDCAVVERTTHIENGLPPLAGTTSITIAADPGTTWKATAQYATSTTTEWGVNANGQSYGVPNVNGVPDLTPAIASNGEWGYVFSEDVMAMEQEGFINVYESDGTTVVGQQPIQIAENIPLDETKIPRSLPFSTDSD